MTNYLPNEYGLLVLRPSLKLRAVSGDVIPHNSDESILQVFSKPWALNEKDGNYVGVKSGKRSALVTDDDGVVYKIRGCMVEQALNCENTYYKTYRRHYPFGGDTLPIAFSGLQQTDSVDKICHAEGFEFPLHPFGLFKYSVDFSNRLALYRIIQYFL